MKVKEFTVSIDSSMGFSINCFIIDAIQFEDINLLVGKNASGKTTIAKTPVIFSEILKTTDTGYVGKYIIQFIDDNGDIYKYSYHYSEGKLEELLLKNSATLIDRSNATAKILNEGKNKFEEVNPPALISIISTRRDSLAYPYIEKLIEWAKGVHLFKFGHIHPFDLTKTREDSLTGFKEFNSYLGTIDEIEKELVIKEFNSLGYVIENIEFSKNDSDRFILSVKEKGVEYTMDEFPLSQGMFRSLWSRLYLNYLIKARNASLIIIDDLCEGLDYSRATALGKLLFQKMEDSNVQFIATSNDRFLMNVVDIKYWNILYRKGEKIQSYNYSNSKEQFDEFKLIGLNNFDLFTSDFLATDR